MDSAAKLQLLPQRSDDDGVVWKLTHGHSARTYVDAAGVVDRIRLWAEAALRVAVMQEWGHAPAPLLVSGLVKVGALARSVLQLHPITVRPTSSISPSVISPRRLPPAISIKLQ